MEAKLENLVAEWKAFEEKIKNIRLEYSIHLGHLGNCVDQVLDLASMSKFASISFKKEYQEGIEDEAMTETLEKIIMVLKQRNRWMDAFFTRFDAKLPLFKELVGELCRFLKEVSGPENARPEEFVSVPG